MLCVIPSWHQPLGGPIPCLTCRLWAPTERGTLEPLCSGALGWGLRHPRLPAANHLELHLLSGPMMVPLPWLLCPSAHSPPAPSALFFFPSPHLCLFLSSNLCPLSLPCPLLSLFTLSPSAPSVSLISLGVSFGFCVCFLCVASSRISHLGKQPFGPNTFGLILSLCLLPPSHWSIPVFPGFLLIPRAPPPAPKASLPLPHPPSPPQASAFS